VHVVLLLCLCAAAVFAEDSHGQLTLGSGDVDVLKDFELAPAGGGPVSNARDSKLDIKGARDELAKMAAVSKNATAHATAAARVADAKATAASNKAFDNATKAADNAQALAKGMLAKADADSKLATAMQKKNELEAAAQKMAQDKKLEVEAQKALEADEAKKANALKKMAAIAAIATAQAAKDAKKGAAPKETLVQRTARIQSKESALAKQAVQRIRANVKLSSAQKKAQEAVAAAQEFRSMQLRRKTASGLALWQSVNELRKARAFRLKADKARAAGIKEYGLTTKEFDQGMQQNEAGAMIHKIVKQFRKWTWKVYNNGYKLRQHPNDEFRPAQKIAESVDKELVEIKDAMISITDRLARAKDGSKAKARERKTLLAAYSAQLRHEDLGIKIKRLQGDVDYIYNEAYSILHDKFPQVNLKELAEDFNAIVAAKLSGKKAIVIPRMTAAGVKSLLGLEGDMLKGAYLAYTIKLHSQKLRAQRKEIKAAYKTSKSILKQAKENAKGIPADVPKA